LGDYKEGLSDKTWAVVQKMYPDQEQEEVAKILAEQCGNNLPFCDTFNKTGLERVRFAVLKLSKGNIEKLRNAVGEAQTDWRDTFMAAGFAQSLFEHIRWAEKYLIHGR
jgi:hypothetical protein